MPRATVKNALPALRAFLLCGSVAVCAAGSPRLDDSESRGGCPPDWDGTVDVRLLGLHSVNQLARAAGRVVMLPAVSVKNVGTADVPWYSQFSGAFPPHGNDQHPFLVWSAYRVADGALRQLGVSDVRHAIPALNTQCPCAAGSHLLGVGCEDTNASGTNAANELLAPRGEITAHTGLWAHCDEPRPDTPSHFDPDGDCVQDHTGQGEDAFSHGLVVREADLREAGAVFYFQAWYVVRGDVDLANSMGYRKIEPSFSGSSWSFSLRGPLVSGSPVDAWVDPRSPGPGASNETLVTVDGRLQLAARARDLGDGWWRFDYALVNHDYDRRIQAFTLPLPDGISIDAIGFDDPDDDPRNDWLPTVARHSLEWRAPTAGAAADWGTLFHFSFEADAAPEPADAVLLPVEPGASLQETIPTLGLGPAALIFADGFESGDASAWAE